MSVTLIIVADLGCLKAFRLTKDEIIDTQKLELIERSGSLKGTESFSEQVTDQAGRFPVGNAIAGGQMSHGENHNLANEMELRSIRQLAEEVGRFVSEENPDRWYFAANNEIEQRVVDALSDPVRRKLTRRVRKNLTKVDRSELLGHFKGVRT